MPSLPALTATRKTTAHNTATRIFYFIVYSFVACFGLWTVLCNAAYVFSLKFRTLSSLSPIVLLAGILCALLLVKGTANQDTQQSATNYIIPKPSRVTEAYLVAAVLILSVRAFCHNGYTAFWVLSVIFLVAVLIALRHGQDLLVSVRR
jgi:DMSO reductase anchor subunit